MAGVELGTAYLSLVASTSGLASSVRKGMGVAESEAEKGGKKVGGKFSGALKVAAVAGVAAAGVATAKAFGDAINREKLGDKTAAALGLNGRQAKRAGKVSADLYAGAWGDSMADVTGAVESVMSSIDGMSKASPKRLKDVTASVLDIANAFDVDVDQAATNAGILMKTGLAPNATAALDLITAGLQKVPKALRGEVMDATSEYSDMFAALGFTGKESMGLLVSATENGQYGIDKMGDAIKEFTIRGTDMSKTTKDAYKAIGLNSRNMTNDLLAGGDKAQGAFQKIVKGIQGIKDPAKQSEAAIALFGAPLEDLGTKDIPKFLDSLTGAGKGMGDVKGAAKDMGETLNDNLGTRLEGYKRKLQTLASDGMMSLIEGFESGESKGEGFKGVMSKIGVAVKNVSEWVVDNKEFVFAVVGAWGAWKLAVLGHTAAIKAAGVATKVWTGITKAAAIAQKALNLVMRANPIGLVITLIAGLVAGLVWFFTKTKVGKKIVETVWGAIKKAIKAVADWWTDTAWPAIKKVIQALGDWFKKAGEKIGDVWEAIKTAIRTAWIWVRDKVFVPLAAALLKMREAFKKAKEKVGDAWDAIKESAKKVWDWVKENIFARWGRALENLRGWFNTAKDKIKGAWDAIKSKLKAGWDWIGEKVFEPMKKGVNKIKDAFQNVKDGIKKAWDQLKRIAAKPINFILGDVFNDKLRVWWNKIARAVGLDGLVLEKADLVKFADGGVLPGYTPGRDVHMFTSPTGGRLALSGGEAIMRPEFTRAVGGKAGVDRLNAMARRGVAFADGGTVDHLMGAGGARNTRGQFYRVTDFAKKLWDIGSYAVEVIKDPVGAIRKAFSSLMGAAGTGGNKGDLFRMVTQMPLNFAADLGKKVKEMFAEGRGNAGTGGAGLTGNLGAMEAAVKALDPTARVTSGYRPGARTVTGVTSLHAQGRALDFVSSDMGALWDKLYADFGETAAEIFYSGRYFSRYGKLGAPRDDHWDHVHWAMKNGGVLPKLYDNGGWLPTGTSVVQNKTGRPEPVFTGDQFDQMMTGPVDLSDASIDKLAHALLVGAETGTARRLAEARRAEANSRQTPGRRS